MSLIELKNVSKVYSNRSVPVYALRNVNLKIKKGENIAIIGPSGSGKSTLLHILGCLDRPTKGKVFIDGKDVSNLNDNQLAFIRRKRIGFVFQFFNLIPSFTALKNVELPMIFSKRKDREERAKKLLKLVGLEKRMGHYPSQLSGGEAQRVAIARALANDPEILLADEPTGNLDTKSGKDIMKLLSNLNKKYKLTLVIVTHDIFIAKHAKRIIYLRDGKIIKEERKK